VPSGLLLLNKLAVADAVPDGLLWCVHRSFVVHVFRPLFGGLLWLVSWAHLIHLQRRLQRGLLLPLWVDVRDAVFVPGRPLLPIGHVLGGAVPLPRGHVLARRRVLHGAGLVHSVPGRIVRQRDGAHDRRVHGALPGRHVRQHNGAHDCRVHRRVPDWLLLPPGLNLRDADYLPGRLLLPRGRRRADGLLMPVRVLEHGPDL
jgi:hypothetical protein